MGLECKSRKSRNTRSNRPIWPWSTEWSRAKANRVLPRECTGHSKHSLPTTQENTLHMYITRCQHRNQIFFAVKDGEDTVCKDTVSKNKTRSWVWHNHELLIAKLRLKLEKVGKTTRPFRYDLNQIPYDTVEVTNRLKGLDLIECLKNYGQRFVTFYRRQWSRPSPRKRNIKKQNGCLSRPYK